jgi:hypothetical protein
MKVIVDQRIVIEADSYHKVGQILDKIAEATERVSPTEKAKVTADFVNFQTRPCKAMVMERAIYDTPQPELTQQGGRF